MDLDLSFLKRYFKGFYNVVIIFVAITVLFFILSFFSRLKAVEGYVYDFHQEVLTFIEQDLKAGNLANSDEYSFYQKYNSAHLKFVDNIIVVKSNNQAFFSGNADKTYAYKGVGKNGDVTLGNVVLKDNLVTSRRLTNGTEILVLTTKSFVQNFTFSEWIGERRIQFTVSILVPIMIMVFLMLIEDKVIKELQGKFYQYFELIKDQESEMDALYAGLFYQNSSIMLLINPETGKVINGNESAIKYYGYQFIEENISIDQINTMPQDVINDLMQEAMVEKRNYFNFQHRLKNGMIRDVEVYAGSVRIKGETVLCSIIHDVTDKIRAEQELLNKKVEMENSIREKSEILATISHEIKTPIAGVIHNIQDLTLKVKDPETLKQLQFLKLNIDSLNRLVFDLLDYSRIDAGGFKMYSTQFNLAEVLEGSVQLFKPVANEKKIKLDLDLKNLQKKRFVGDAFRIGQIVNNLISNSIKYTHDGKISIKASDELMDHQSLVTVVVEDTGIGMKPEVVQQIFKRFFTTDKTGVFTGTGLGLTICRLIVEAMDGTLEVDSVEGHGTKITLTLELDNDEGADVSLLNTASPLDASGLESIADEKPVSILLVDDDPMNLLFLEKMIKASAKRTLEIVTAFNAKEGIELAKNRAFDFIFCDYQLPDQLGTQFFTGVREIREEGYKGKMILMSADEVKEISPSDEFWLKPIELAKVARLFENVKAKQESVLSLRDLENHVYLRWPEWNSLMELMEQQESEGIMRIFIKALDEKWNVLPKECSDDSDQMDRTLRILHAIKGSTSYFKSEKFLKVIYELEGVLKSSGQMEDKVIAYKAFLEGFRIFIEEAKTIEVLLKRQMNE